MAISATIVLDRSQAPRTQKVRALLTVSNSGANPVAILNIVPFVQNSLFPEPQNSSVAIGQCITNQAVIPPSGSNTFVWDMNFHTANPVGNYDTPVTNSNYNVGCLIYGDDGSVTSPTVQPLLVIPAKNYGSF